MVFFTLKDFRVVKITMPLPASPCSSLKATPPLFRGEFTNRPSSHTSRKTLCLARSRGWMQKRGGSVFLNVRDQRAWWPVRKFYPKEGRGCFKRWAGIGGEASLFNDREKCWRKKILEFLKQYWRVKSYFYKFCVLISPDVPFKG